MQEWDENDEYCGRECYVFNSALSPEMDDECCEHCAKFLTQDCEYIEEFMEE